MDDAFSWPDAVAVIGIVVMVTGLIGGPIAALVQIRKAKITSGQEDSAGNDQGVHGHGSVRPGHQGLMSSSRR